jgi:hypothetical protein
MLTVMHYYEPDAAMHWLEFSGKPDAETRQILKKAGWRFIGAVMQWRHQGLLTPLPELPGYQYEEGGEVDYSEARAEHYEARAEKAQARRTAAHQRADSISSMIPFGQPILVGHHSERRHRRDLAKIDKSMRTAIQEGEKAERLQNRAEASLAQRERKHDPGAIARRLTEIRKQYQLYQDATDAEDIRRRDLLAGEIKRLEAELEEAGGLPADQISLQKGDLILIHGHIVEIIRVNKKTITGYLASPVHNLLSRESGYSKRDKRDSGQFDRTRFSLRIYTAQEWAAANEGQTQAEAYAVAEAHFKEIRQRAE